MRKEILFEKFKEHKIFDYYWSDSVIKCFEGELTLKFIPQEYIGFYQKEIELPLPLVNDNDGRLEGTTSKMTMKLTSMTETVFDIEKAIQEIDNPGVDCAIFIKIDVRDKENSLIFSTQFNLGSSDPEKIETTSEYFRELSIFLGEERQRR